MRVIEAHLKHTFGLQLPLLAHRQEKQKQKVSHLVQESTEKQMS